MSSKGRMTVPIEAGMDYDLMKDILERWGADAVRNSDGTDLPDQLQEMKMKVYSTYFPTRNDQLWAHEHPDQRQQMYIMTPHTTAVEESLQIELMKGYYREQLEVDYDHDPKRWWEVINRTTGEIVDPESWSVDPITGIVTLHQVNRFHTYTVTFLVWQIWDQTQMYNHITNQWGDKPHEIPYDARHSPTWAHITEYMKDWLEANKHVDVVRFTTFFYHFTIIFNELAKEKYVDWFGYSTTVSPLALEQFEAEYGYRMRPEYLVDQGYHNTPFRNPSKQYRDWMQFQHKFVCKQSRELVDITHQAGREAIMFLGDNWIGTEPYGDLFPSIGLDAVVGSVGNGATLRMISDIPGVKYTEGRFLPYFFPDVFYEGGNPTAEAIDNWVKARRAILRKPVDRIGYGGYLSLAASFPDFITCVEQISDEFRTLYERMNGTKAYTPKFKVAVLNSWGKLRSWQTTMVAHSLWYKKIYTYLGMLESLSGLAVDVEFISFDDVLESGIPEDIGVILNAGDAGTAWSGDDYWANEAIIACLKQFVYNGGGFIGIGEPSAFMHQGRFFQMSDVLGVDKEIGYTLSYTKYDQENTSDHFIMGGQAKPIDCGEKVEFIRSVSEQTQIIQMQRGDIAVAANSFGKGRSVYIAGIPYSPANSRLLLRSIYWAASAENEMSTWYCDNVETECAVYLETGWGIVINNSQDPQRTKLYKNTESYIEVELKPGGHEWFRVDSLTK
ncbi:1,3-beta-galactosyl-N-acetylhexosamine phosphorylase [Paenibacillus pseudetheri]|uniref:1,3-beta-galactosyl-N-acetylhexosamine phosphorylase n=2 Tax=Paenibacillus pseudetheri TaxID=2897682 RepID=A0ABN8FLT2_9BACL|nr:1,3-beta-galactosyl-N-acetylhexosamine phosphorylase [Paenibacillus pseudetheri]CAH1057412.1 1,3-beta-galactosyl-N-acetylhexosamine phosphorylase [Paenibacillus pseudetheri]